MPWLLEHAGRMFLYSCDRCGRKAWQRPHLWPGYCHLCSDDCLMKGPPKE
jgi:DNA-directed RNA polymerase subunit RPC12/RpoP